MLGELQAKTGRKVFSVEQLPMMTSTRFAITFDAGYAVLSRALFISPSDSYVELAGNEVSVRMGWTFRATFARASPARR